MTTERQKLTIAKFCGWTHLPKDKDMAQYVAQMPNGKWDKIPDYCNDLNAMHEAEHHLSYEERKQYCMTLCDITGSDWGLSDAATRASAFLITIGKWEDEQ